MTENPKTQVKLYAQASQPLSKHKCHRADKVQTPRPDLRIVPRVRNRQSNKKRGQGQTNQYHSCHTRHWRVRAFRRAWGMRHAAHCAGCLVAVGPSPIPGGVASCVKPIRKSARGFAFRSLRLLCPFVCCLFLFCFLSLPHWSSTAVQIDPIVNFVFSHFHPYIEYKGPSLWASSANTPRKKNLVHYGVHLHLRSWVWTLQCDWDI